MPDSANTKQYFATLPAKDLPKELMERVRLYDDYVNTSGLQALWSRSYAYYNRGIYKSGRLNRVGEQGEYTEIYINHFRNLLTHILNMTTNQRPSFDARAANTDHKSQAQTIVANNILDYYNRVKGMDSVNKTAVEDCLQFADGYIYQGWDVMGGDPYVANPGSAAGVAKQGEVNHRNFTPLDVIFDFAAGLNDVPRQWHIIRDFQNKWDLVAQYPAMKDKILRAADDSEQWRYMRVGARWNYPTDYVPVFIFIHERTSSVPNGRYMTLVSDDCWLMDSQLPAFYKKSPLYRLCASKQRGSGFGYTIAYDLLPIAEAIDGLYSTVITNQSTFGVQNITIPTGGSISVSDLVDGLNLIEYDPKFPEPKALNLLSTPKEIFDFISKLEQVMETVSGVNSVARGNPESSLKSGSALALVQSMAIQFISGLQQSSTTVMEDVGTGLINILKACAQTPRMIEIAGKSNKAYLKEFTAADISNVNRVTVDIGNPISRTTAGKVSMADNLLQSGIIKDPEQYIQVLTTGKLEPLIEGQQSELMLIRSENEALADGVAVPALLTDNHPLHIQEHKSVLASPETRKDPKIVNAVLTHIQEHLDLWQQVTPAMAMATQEQMAPPPPVPTPPPGAPAPDGAGAGSPAAVLAPGNSTTEKAAAVRLPNLPKNPLTKEPALAAAGG